MDRYKVPSSEDYEPGSENKVLKNYLSITSKEIIENLEANEFKRTELELIRLFDLNHHFSVEDICDIHELWLGDIYPFAGRYRTVSMEKDGFPFANPNRIPDLMKKFEKEYLNKYTPCHISDSDELANVLGLVHVEFILIHPFREGNGRIARLLSNHMVLQSGKPPLDFNLISQIKSKKGFVEYVSAIQEGLGKNYIPIYQIFKKLLNASNDVVSSDHSDI